MSAESHTCPNCGAPLKNTGNATTVVCDHCGSVVNLPPAPRRAEPVPSQPELVASSRAASLALGPADAAQVIQLLRENQEQAAIQLYQSRTGASFDEAVDAVRIIRASLRDMSQPPAVSFTPPPPFTPYSPAPTTSRPARSGFCSCGGVLLGLVALFMCFFGGCGVYLQTKSVFQCGLHQAEATLVQRDILTPPVNGGYLVVAGGFHESGSLTSSYLDAQFWTPVWGHNGWGVLNGEVTQSSGRSGRITATLLKDGNTIPVLSDATVSCSQ